MRIVTLPDGTLRRSIGARTLRGVSSPLTACQNVGGQVGPLRSIVEEAARRFLEMVQPLQAGGQAMVANGDPYRTLAAVANAGEQLEHFHVYETRPSQSPPAAAATADARGAIRRRTVPGQPAPTAAAGVAASQTGSPTTAMPANRSAYRAVPLHTDAGLFLAFVPAVHLTTDTALHLRKQGHRQLRAPATGHASASTALAYSDTAEPDGFYVVAREGTRLYLSADAQATSVVLLLGEAWGTHINAQLLRPLRPAPHAMEMAPHAREEMAADADGGRLRAWYGRMYLPPGDHPPPAPPANETSAVARRRTAADLTNAAAAHHLAMPSSSGTSSSEAIGKSAVVMLDAEACLDDQVFCWMQCMYAPRAPPPRHPTPRRR
jgi:hypothetical protein